MTYTFHTIIINLTVLETPHVIVGAAIATHVVNPALALPLAFGSHFVLERIPHWNPHLSTELKKYGKITKNSTTIIVIDAVLALFIGTFIAAQVLPDVGHFLTILAACFFAVLPDVVEAPYYFLKKRGKYSEKWISIQKSIQNDADIVPGLASQFITILIAFWWIAY